MKVLSYGEILWDVINGTEHLGGAPFNFAAHIAQCGNESMIVSRLGSDYLGMKAFNQSKTHGVDVSLIEWDEVFPTGTVNVTLQNGQPDYVIHENVAYDFISADAAVLQCQKQNFDLFYFGSLAQRNAVSRQALQKLLSVGHFTHVFYDVNLRKSGYDESIVKDSLKFCTIFKLNNDEVSIIGQLLTGETLTNENLCQCVKTLFPNVSIVIITAADKGCFIHTSNKFLYVPGIAVSVVDAVGAGDAFSAAFMHVYCASGNAFAAAQVANQVGAFVATRTGAIPAYDRATCELLSQHSLQTTEGTQPRL